MAEPAGRHNMYLLVLLLHLVERVTHLQENCLVELVAVMYLVKQARSFPLSVQRDPEPRQVTPSPCGTQCF